MMSTVYHLNASDLNQHFLEEIKETFGDQEIEIIISDLDETEYLLKSEAHKNQLLKAVDNVKQRQNLVEVDWANLPWQGGRILAMTRR